MSNDYFFLREEFFIVLSVICVHSVIGKCSIGSPFVCLLTEVVSRGHKKAK